MTIGHSSESQAHASERPIGVWILTICDGLIAGIIPAFGSILIFFYDDELRLLLDFSVFNAVVSVILGVAVCCSAYRAWAGDDRFMRLLLVLVTVHWGLTIFNNAAICFTDFASQLGPFQRLKLYTNIVYPGIWLIINYCYLLGSRPRAFYASHNPPDRTIVGATD